MFIDRSHVFVDVIFKISNSKRFIKWVAKWTVYVKKQSCTKSESESCLFTTSHSKSYGKEFNVHFALQQSATIKSSSSASYKYGVHTLHIQLSCILRVSSSWWNAYASEKKNNKKKQFPKVTTHTTVTVTFYVQNSLRWAIYDLIINAAQTTGYYSVDLALLNFISCTLKIKPVLDRVCTSRLHLLLYVIASRHLHRTALD